MILSLGGYAALDSGFSLFAVNNLHVSVHAIGLILFFNTSTIVVLQFWVVNKIQGRSRARVLGLVAAAVVFFADQASKVWMLDVFGIEGKGAISTRDLVRNSLRMRPDRIIVGEVRGAEALDMLQAMNTGHDGSLTTTHANSPAEAVARLETLCLMSGLDLPAKAIREQIIAKKIDFAGAAKQYSQEANGPMGGVIGFIPRKFAVDDAFAQVAFSLKPGEISEPVVTEYGAHLIQLNERRQGPGSTWEKAKADAREFYIEEMFQAVLAQQRKAARIEVLLK